MKCETCKFYVPGVTEDGTVGTCRRYPPWADCSDLPVVNADFWCGDYADPDADNLASRAMSNLEADLSDISIALDKILDAILREANLPAGEPKAAVLQADPDGPTDEELRAADVFDGPEKTVNAEVPTDAQLYAEGLKATSANPKASKETVRDVLEARGVKKVRDLGDDGRAELYLALKTITEP